MRRTLLSAGLVAALMVSGPVALAQEMTVTPEEPEPGGNITVEGDCGPENSDQTVDFFFNGDEREPAGTDATTDDEGAFTAELTVPEDAEGEVILIAECTGDGSQLTTSFTVAEQEPAEEEPTEEEPTEEEPTEEPVEETTEEETVEEPTEEEPVEGGAVEEEQTEQGAAERDDVTEAERIETGGGGAADGSGEMVTTLGAAAALAAGTVLLALRLAGRAAR